MLWWPPESISVAGCGAVIALQLSEQNLWGQQRSASLNVRGRPPRMYEAGLKKCEASLTMYEAVWHLSLSWCDTVMTLWCLPQGTYIERTLEFPVASNMNTSSLSTKSLYLRTILCDRAEHQVVTPWSSVTTNHHLHNPQKCEQINPTHMYLCQMSALG